MTNILTKAKKRALDTALNTLSRKDTTEHNAPHLTCTEAEAFYNLLLEFGRKEEADQWLNSHAASDTSPNNLHFKRGEKVRATL